MIICTVILVLLVVLIATEADSHETLPAPEDQPPEASTTPQESAPRRLENAIASDQSLTPGARKPRFIQQTRLVRAALVAMLCCATVLLSGCVSNRYRKAKKDVPPPSLLNVVFAPSPLGAKLDTLITYNGPGSWKRDAFWDEYVVTLHNPGNEPLTVTQPGLMDYAGAAHPPGDKPWALEKASKTLEQRYKDAGMAFVRYTSPAVLIVGAGTAAAVSSGMLSAGATSAAGATVVALPLYYFVVLNINYNNRKTMEREFDRRRLVLPLRLAPGETHTGSLFFPMVPSPRSLGLHWSSSTASGEAVLPLDFLSRLHLQTPATPTPSPSSSKGG